MLHRHGPRAVLSLVQGLTILFYFMADMRVALSAVLSDDRSSGRSRRCRAAAADCSLNHHHLPLQVKHCPPNPTHATHATQRALAYAADPSDRRKVRKQRTQRRQTTQLKRRNGQNARTEAVSILALSVACVVLDRKRL